VDVIHASQETPYGVSNLFILQDKMKLYRVINKKMPACGAQEMEKPLKRACVSINRVLISPVNNSFNSPVDAESR
jgi:hypothetical protein